MKSWKSWIAAGICVVGLAGCSDQTKQETREAVDEAGDAVRSAAEDTAENVKKGAEAVKGAAEDVGDKLDGDDAADGTP
jgi:uncharacterized lipoprotein